MVNTNAPATMFIRARQLHQSVPLYPLGTEVGETRQEEGFPFGPADEGNCTSSSTLQDD